MIALINKHDRSPAPLSPLAAARSAGAVPARHVGRPPPGAARQWRGRTAPPLTAARQERVTGARRPDL